jgi:ABC-type Fe3+ transport system permease subunit
MNIGEILIWESSNLLLLIPVVIGLVMLMRWFQGRAVFTQRDWLGQPRGKVLSLHLWLKFAVLWVAIVLIGFVDGYVLSVTLSFEGETQSKI